jgi:hypothetical protein
LNIVAAIILILHGLVHLLYTGQAMKLFELKPGMAWPVEARLFSRLPGDRITRSVAAAGCVVSAVLFVVGAVGIIVSQEWWRPVIVTASAFSTALFLLLWDGKRKGLADSGLIAILINIVLLILVLVVGWPYSGF